MMADYIIYRMGWPDIWMPAAGFPGVRGPVVLKRFLAWLYFSRGARWWVGIWTGPDGDLLCVKKCDTREDAERYLSPGAPTLTLAALFALGVRYGWLRTDRGGRVVWPWSKP